MFGNALIIRSLWVDVKEETMLNRWLENEPKETLICAVASAVSLILNITGALKGILPFDIAWVDGRTILTGKEDFMRGQGIDLSACADAARDELDQGATVVYVAADAKLLGFISLRDTVREDAKKTLEKLKAVGITPMLLTGDNRQAAGSIAASVGISDVRANLLPEEKMNIIKGYAGGTEPICMIGDGVNDALALTSADAGIAMGGIGSDIAIESADAVLVSDEIKRLPYLFSLMHKVMKKVQVNIIASLVINLSAVVLSALGILTPITGALWHNCGSVFVVVNTALLLRLKDTKSGN